MANAPATATSISAREWADLLFDDGSFSEQFAGIGTPDPLHFEDSRPYAERVNEAREQSGGRRPS